MTDTKRQIELPSQQRLVKRLLTAIQPSRAFILLHGTLGSGKTTLLELFLVAASNPRKLILNATTGLDLVSARQILLEQLAGANSANIDPTLPLIESIGRWQNEQQEDLIICVDDIHLLPEAFLDELWTLLRAFELLNIISKLAIIVTAPSSYVRQQQLSDEHLGTLAIEIAPLELPERRIFLYEMAVQSERRLDLTKIGVDSLIANSRGNPTALLHSLESCVMDEIKTEERPNKRSNQPQNGSRGNSLDKQRLLQWGFGGFCLLVLLSFWFPVGKEESVTPTDAQKELVTPPASTAESAPSPSSAVGTNSASAAVAVSENTTLPTPISAAATVTTDTTHYAGREVVIDDKSIQQLEKLEAASSGATATTNPAPAVVAAASQTPAVKGSIETSSAPIPVKATEDKVAKSSAPTVKATVKATPVPVPVKVVPLPKAMASGPAPVTLTSGAQLKAKNPAHYTIQLVGASKLSDISKFIGMHQLNGKVKTYETRFQGAPWYVVILGDYSSSTAARKAINGLSPDLQKGQPWAKSFAQVQKELP